MKRISLDERLKGQAENVPEPSADRFPLTGQSFYDIFRAIDLLEMDRVGLYGAESFPFGMLSPEQLELIHTPFRDGEVLSYDGVIASLFNLLWAEYHIGESERALPRPHDPEHAEQLYQLLRELLITPFLRIDALRSLPRRCGSPRTLTIWSC